jgi:hypothetical protein
LDGITAYYAALTEQQMQTVKGGLERKGYYSSEEKTENPVLMYQQQMEYRQQGEGTVNSLSHFF